MHTLALSSEHLREFLISCLNFEKKSFILHKYSRDISSRHAAYVFWNLTVFQCISNVKYCSRGILDRKGYIRMKRGSEFVSALKRRFILHFELKAYSRHWNKRSPWNNRSTPLKNFHVTISLLFYINCSHFLIFFFFNFFF